MKAIADFAIEMSGITKVFPGVIAANNIDFSVYENEIHAILGENGAGKSTLMSMLFGSYSCDSGTIKVHGHEIKNHSPLAATKLGIGMVHQHFRLVSNFSVTENITLGREILNSSGHLDRVRSEKRIEELSSRYGLDVDPAAKIEDISVAMRQRTEILKLLYRDAEILILDEPTAILSPLEIEELLDILKRLHQEGKTIILITHKLPEIMAIAHRCTVLRKGRAICTVAISETSSEELARMMIGRKTQKTMRSESANPGDICLDVENLSMKDRHRMRMAVENLSFVVRSGEIVGIAGVDGNGQAELAEAIVGLSLPDSGSIVLNGRNIADTPIRERIRSGLSFIPDDRQRLGLVLDFSIEENLVLKSFKKQPFCNSWGLLDPKAIRKNALTLIEQFDIRTSAGPAAPIAQLSGGNQQKAIIARELKQNPKVMLISQPTQGLDVGAIEYIHQRILEEKNKGAAILLISFDLDEILALCDRIIVISRGKVAGTLSAAQANETNLGLLMAGSEMRAPE